MEYKESIFNGYKRLDFVFEGRECILIMPENKNGKWLMQMEYFWAFPENPLTLMGMGYSYAFVKNKSRWGGYEDQEVKRDFADFVAVEFGLKNKFIPWGMSCGGLHALKFAECFPEHVSLLYVDAPVTSLLGYPVLSPNKDTYERIKGEIMTGLGFTDYSEIFVYNDNAISRLPELILADVPVALVYGDSDKTVDPKYNAEILLSYYKSRGGKIKAWCKPGCDHHPHGLPDKEMEKELIEYVLENER